MCAVVHATRAWHRLLAHTHKSIDIQVKSTMPNNQDTERHRRCQVKYIICLLEIPNSMLSMSQKKKRIKNHFLFAAVLVIVAVYRWHWHWIVPAGFFPHFFFTSLYFLTKASAALHSLFSSPLCFVILRQHDFIMFIVQLHYVLDRLAASLYVSVNIHAELFMPLSSYD